MAVAKSFVQAAKSEGYDAVVLVVCVELCSIHGGMCGDRSKILGYTVFADGAAAALIGPGAVGDWAIGEQRTQTCDPTTRDYMTWNPGNHGYIMHLDKGIGMAFGKELFRNFQRLLREMVGTTSDIEFCVHPGGKRNESSGFAGSRWAPLNISLAIAALLRFDR